MSQEQSAVPTLNAVVRDVRSMAIMLRAIAFTPLCQVTLSEMGLQVITEVNGVLQATAYLSCGLFAEFSYNPPQEDLDAVLEDVTEGGQPQLPTTVFELSLSNLLVCLNIYGNAGISVPGKSKESDEEAARRKERERMANIRGESLATQMRLSYSGIGHPLILELHEGKTSTRCELQTYIANPALFTEMDFINEQVVGQVIMQSKDITEALQSIDTSTKEVNFSFINSTRSEIKQQQRERHSVPLSQHQIRGASSIILSTADGEDDDEDSRSRYSNRERNGADGNEEVQMLRIRAEGVSGSTELDFPNQNKIFEQFTSTHDSSTSYHFADIQRCLKAMQTSLKTSLRIDDQGMMSLQCLFPRKIEALADALSTSSNNKPDPEKNGFVELKVLPITDDEEE